MRLHWLGVALVALIIIACSAVMKAVAAPAPSDGEWEQNFDYEKKIRLDRIRGEIGQVEAELQRLEAERAGLQRERACVARAPHVRGLRLCASLR